MPYRGRLPLGGTVRLRQGKAVTRVWGSACFPSTVPNIPTTVEPQLARKFLTCLSFAAAATLRLPSQVVFIGSRNVFF